MNAAAHAPRVSVVVPVFNKERYLHRAVDSVLAQTVGEFELLLVDDGSTDGSLAVARGYDDPRVRVLTQSNGGAGAARNHGIREARAPMIALLDGDDQWAPTFLEEMLSLADAFPQAGIYCAPYVYVEPGDVEVSPNWVGVPARGLVPDYFRSVALGDLVATATSVCIPRHVLDAVGPFQSERFGEDQDFWVRIALSFPVAAISGAPLTRYFRNAQGRVMHTDVPDAELPYSVRLQSKLDAGQVPESLRDGVRLYIEQGLITLVSLNLRAGKRDVARRMIDDPRIRRFWARQAFWRVLITIPGLTKFSLAVIDMVRKRSVAQALRR